VILGCGVDLIEVGRFELEVAGRDGGLVEELFSVGELAWCRRRRRACEGYAMAYAAKEALFKALGTGKVGRMAWSDIEVGWPQGAARPTLTLTGETAKAARQLGTEGVHVTMTSTRQLGAAWVMLTGRGPCPPLDPARGGPEPVEGRADGKRPGHPRPDAGVRDESRVPSPESRRT
jgi:holo-[acyl-carrier protein] synthase